jgi:hypothetical protein
VTEQPFEPRADTGEIFRSIIKHEVESESLHIEAFLTELFSITPEEHAEAVVWMTKKMDGKDPGPLPPSMERVAAGPPIDDRLLELARKYEMRDNPFRAKVLNNIYYAAIKTLGGLPNG